MQDKLFTAELMVLTLLIGPAIVVLWHSSFAVPRAPIVNDNLLHFMQARRAFWIARAAPLHTWVWAPLNFTDHILGGHGLGFPFFLHYQHMSHLILALVAAVARVTLIYLSFYEHLL